MELLVSATSLVEHVAFWLRSGEINVSTLQIVNKDRDRFLELYSLLPKAPENTSLEEEFAAGSKASGNHRETAGVEVLLEMRAEELEAFEKERDAVSTFIHMCSLIKSGILLKYFFLPHRPIYYETSPATMKLVCFANTTNVMQNSDAAEKWK